MKQSDENFVSMCKVVRDVLSKHEVVWSPRVAFKNQVSVFGGLMDEMDLAMESAEIVSTGATDNKTNAEMQVVLLAVNLAKRGSVYAMEVGNLELHDQLRVTKSTMLRRPDTLTLAKLRDIHSRLGGVIAELADYGVLPADLADLKSKTDVFDGLIARPRILIVERKTANQDIIPGLLSGLWEVLYKMDSLINLFEGTDLKREYKDARIIVDLGRRKEGEPDVPTK